MTEHGSPWDALGDLDTFGQQWWGKAPLHRGVTDFDPSSVISLHDLDRVITSRQTDARLFDGKGHVDLAEHRAQGLRRTDERTWLADPSAVLDRFRTGSTIVMPTAHEIWAPIGALAARLEVLLDSQVGATLFVAPPGSLTDWHVDPGHVFVLHLYGEKHWLIERQRSGEVQIEPPHMFTLAPGDLLYLPHGFLHRVRGTQAPAVHVSFYLSALTWSDLLTSALTSRMQTLISTQLQRSAVNPRWGHRSRARWSTELDALLDRLSAEIDHVRRELPAGDFDSLAPDRTRRPQSVVDHTDAFLHIFQGAATRGQRFRIQPQLQVVHDIDDVGSDAWSLRLDGAHLDVPQRWSNAVAHIVHAQRREFSLSDLGLATGEAHALVDRLTREGAVTR